MPGTITVMVSIAILAAVCVAVPWFRGRAGRTFRSEFARLVETTPIDWRSLRGPGPTPADVLGRHAGNLQAKPLTATDFVYYTSSWQHVKGEFAESPVGALQMAEHLTANLLMARGLIPAGSWRPGVLPVSWSFRTAEGYRRAQRISYRAGADEAADQESEVPLTDLADALALFEAFYREMLTIPATENSDT